MGTPARKIRPDASARPEGGGRPVAGEVQSTTLPDLFHELGVRRATGILTVAGAAAKKSVYFQDGKVQFATSTDRDDRFCQVLIKAGAVPVRNLLRALDLSLATRDRLGEVMIRNRMMAPADIDKWVKIQVREIICGLFNCVDGRWSFEERPFPAEMIALGVAGDAMVIEGIRHVSSWARVYEVVGGLNAEYIATHRKAEIVAGLPLLPGEHQLLRMCDQTTTLGEMCDASDLGDFQVCRSVWALLIVGALIKS